MTSWPVIHEAEVSATDNGDAPTSDGWFVTNIGAVQAEFEAGVQFQARFESPDCRFENHGINVQWLYPGHANGKYHREDAQESLLVLRGTAVLIVEEVERELREWDFVHLPAGTSHIVVATGDEPCAVLFVGSRRTGKRINYPVSAVAARYNASVAAATDHPSVAYAGEPASEIGRMPWPAPPSMGTPD